MATDKDDLTEMISIRVSKGDLRALERVRTLLPLKPITLARMALRLGLATLEDDPSRIRDAGGASERARGAPAPAKRRRSR